MITACLHQPKREESRAKKTAAEAAVSLEPARAQSMALGGILCSVFRFVSSVFCSVRSVVGSISRIGSSIFCSVDSRGSSRRSSTSSLLSLIGSLAGCISSGLGLISSLACRRGRSRGCSLLRCVSSLLSSVSRLLSVLRGILRAIAAGRQQRDERGGE
jgi:ABC-type Fe3+ transport system permease subunit